MWILSPWKRMERSKLQQGSNYFNNVQNGTNGNEEDLKSEMLLNDRVTMINGCQLGILSVYSMKPTSSKGSEGSPLG